MGGKPVSRGFGNISYTALITMDIGEFDLITSFANPMASDYLFTRVTMIRRIVVNKR